MPQYFFDVRDGSNIVDHEGAELHDLQAARLEAVRLAGALLRDHAEQFWQHGSWSMQLTDAAKASLFVLAFSSTNAPSP